MLKNKHNLSADPGSHNINKLSVHENSNTHTHAHTHMHKPMHAHIHTHMHTHTQSHTPMNIQ